MSVTHFFFLIMINVLQSSLLHTISTPQWHVNQHGQVLQIKKSNNLEQLRADHVLTLCPHVGDIWIFIFIYYFLFIST